MATSGIAESNPFHTQAARVYDVLREMIYTRELSPGDPLPLEPTARRLGVSVGPVRDALRTLYHQGLLEKRSRLGYQVVRITSQRLEGYEVVREGLFVQAARRASERVTAVELAELGPLAETLDSLIEQNGNPGEREAAEREFHHEIARIADCPELEQEMVRLGIFGNLVVMISKPELHPHMAIVDALASGDPRRADEEMRKHCGTNRETVLQEAREYNSVEKS